MANAVERLKTSPDNLGRHYDVAVVGSGAGGATIAYALARRGVKVLLLERGQYIPQEAGNQAPDAFQGNKYRTTEWVVYPDGTRQPSGMLYAVGGQTKVYGATLARFREQDFDEVPYPDGISPKWPITYADLEPYYCEAEEIYRVHGSVEGDPTEPFHSRPYPFPPIPHDPYVRRMVDRLSEQAVHPSFVPRGIDLRPGGRCVFCTLCDGYVCPSHGKLDAEAACVQPALSTGNLDLLTGALCRRLITDPSGDRIIAAEVEHERTMITVRADIFIVSCGTLGSATLCLRSANSAHPSGLANSSGLVGRNLMMHNGKWLAVGNRLLPIPRMHQKTFLINDFYFGTPGIAHRLGMIQAAGQDGQKSFIHRRSVSLVLTTEDLPDPDNRVTLTADGDTHVSYHGNNTRPFRDLAEITRDLFAKSGYQVGKLRHYRDGDLVKAVPHPHAVGTMRFGDDPATSVLDPNCRSHDVPNLYVMDGSFMPSSGAMNPALTIMAQALRTADHILSANGWLRRRQAPSGMPLPSG